MSKKLNRGGYSEEAAFLVEQIHYAGGGRPGCGGYCEAIAVETPNGPRFLFHEYREDIRGQFHRLREFPTRGTLVAAWSIMWGAIADNGPPWSTEKPWFLTGSAPPPWIPGEPAPTCPEEKTPGVELD